MKTGLGWLIACCVALAPASLQSQPATVCGPRLATCEGISSPALCAALKRKCGIDGKGSARAPETQEDKSADPSKQEELTELPDCADDEEVVMIPTCQCRTPMELGGTAANDGACASCTDSGVRLECRRIR